MPSSQILTLECADRAGIVAEISNLIAAHGGNILDASQFADTETQRFFMRVLCAEMDASFESALENTAQNFGMSVRLRPVERKPRVLLLGTKEAHCLLALLQSWKQGDLAIEPVALVSNHMILADVAQWYDIPFVHIPVTAETKQDAESKLSDVIEEHQAELIVLARYMQILTDTFCDHYAGQLLNIHHSFLPSFKGARPYHQAHSRGVKLIGATAHFVTADLDEGPIIEQAVVRVSHHHRVADLKRMGREVESSVLLKAVRLVAEDKVMVSGHKTVVFD